MCRLNWSVPTIAALLCSCQVSDDLHDGSNPSRVSYTLDGREVVVEQGLTIARIDETKHLLGPNTYIYFETGERATTSDRIIGDRLRINLPVGASIGRHTVRYKPLPGKADIWVGYRKSVEQQWVADDGVVDVQELGGVGGRLRLTFERLRLSNECGEMRLLSNGSIDVRLGSEDSFPESEVDQGIGSEWDQIGGSVMLENNLLFDLDDQHLVCPSVDYNPLTLSAAESGLGVPKDVLELIAVCACSTGPNLKDVSWSFALIGDLPLAGNGKFDIRGNPYFFEMRVDSAHTPLNTKDDERWFPLETPQLTYHSMTGELGSPVDIELAAPVQFAYVDETGTRPVLDRTRTKQLSSVHAYGFFNNPVSP